MIIIAFSIYFEGNAWTIAIVLFVYFFGINTIFLRVLDEKVVRQLSAGVFVPTYGFRFWGSIVMALIISVFAAYFFLKTFERDVFPAIHFGLGLMAILTAFVSPKFREIETSESLYPEYDVFE